MFNFLEIWNGPGFCVTGGCNNPTEDKTNHCAECHKHMESTRQGSIKDRERAFVKANIREWKALMRKYPDID